jgi:hypothetical protein
VFLLGWALAFAGTEFLLCRLEGLLEADEVFARLDAVEGFALALEVFLGVVGGLDGEATLMTRASTS